jgi:hypothetical protein
VRYLEAPKTDKKSENKPAADAGYAWTVSLPPGWVAGNYALALVQSGNMDFSPLFSVNVPSGYMPSPTSSMSSIMPPMTTPTSNGTMTDDANLMSATMTPAHAMTVTVWDPSCGCHKTTMVPASDCATATGAAGTQYMWYDNECGCTKTAMAPAPTWTGNNYTAPTGGNVPIAPANPTPSHTIYNGTAVQLGSSLATMLGFVAVALFA